MELCDGGSVSDIMRLRRKTLNEGEGLCYLTLSNCLISSKCHSERHSDGTKLLTRIEKDSQRY